MDRFQNILLLYDESPAYPDARRLALDLVKRNSGQLTVLEVLPGFGEYRKIISSILHIEGGEDAIFQESLEALQNSFSPGSLEGMKVEFEVARGKLAAEVTQKVISGSYDLVINPVEHADGKSSISPGTSDMRLLRKCPCPVWIVKKGIARNLKRVVAAVDSGFQEQDRIQLNRQIISLGWDLAGLGGGNLDIVNVWSFDAANVLRGSVESSEFNQLLLEAARDHYQDLNSFVKGVIPSVREDRIHQIKGGVTEKLLSFIRDNSVDVLVMGTVARSGVQGAVIGNTAEKILARVGCSVLALKPEGFKG